MLDRSCGAQRATLHPGALALVIAAARRRAG